MADEKPTTVRVEALQVHSYNGHDYAVGDTYEIDAQLVDSVAAQGKAVRADASKPKAAAPAIQPAKPARRTTPKPAAKTAARPVTKATTKKKGRK